MSYDPEARRDTPLAHALKVRIERDGPLGIADYMAACLLDPQHGYYRRRPVLGAKGDFITAPEISQVFGELIGLWCVVVWQQMGMPARIRVVEIGPGRGTLMRDALRAARVVPGFLKAAEVVLVEVSETLTDEQRQTLAASPCPIRWVGSLDEIAADNPTIVVANELLDAIPIHQMTRTHQGWRERGVGIDATGHLTFVTLPIRQLPMTWPSPAPDDPVGSIREIMSGTFPVADLGRLSAAPLAGVLIDYGHEQSAVGDTLQAVRGQAHEHPLTSPGEADLSTQVNFENIAGRLRSAGLTVDGPVPQAEFLGALGIAERTSRLMSANPGKAGAIEMGVARLMAPTGMGTRFKVLGLRSASVPPLPGFPAR